MTAVARGIDDTSSAVQLNGFYCKIVHFLKVQLYLCIYVLLYLSVYIFYLTIFQPWIFSVQGFSLNIARAV